MNSPLNSSTSNCSLVNLKKSEKIDVHAEEFRINWERLVQLFEMIDRIKAYAGFKSQRFGFVYKHFWGVIFGNFLKKDWSYFFGPSTWENTINNQKNHTSMIQKSNNFSSIAPSYSNFLKCMITKNALNESLIIQTKVIRKNPNSLKLLQKPPIILRAKKIKKLKIEEDKKIQSSRLTKNKNLKRVDSSTFLLRKRVTSSFIQKKRNLSSLKGQTKRCSKTPQHAGDKPVIPSLDGFGQKPFKELLELRAEHFEERTLHERQRTQERPRTVGRDHPFDPHIY